MLIAVCADKGSPGVTSTAAVLTAAWPRPVVLVEMDPSGGDLVLCARHALGGPLAPAPNLLTLAAAVRAGTPEPGVVSAYAQPTAGGWSVVPGHLVAEQAAGMAQLWTTVADACLAADVDVVADLGRIHAGSPAMAVVQAADVVVVVAAPTVAGMLHLRERLTQLLPAAATAGGTHPRRVLPVLVAPERHAAAYVREAGEVIAATGTPVEPVGYLAHDPRALQRLWAGEKPNGRLGRTLLLRSARTVVDTLVGDAAAMDVPA